MCSGHKISGPGIIMDKLSTILVEPGCTAVITKKGGLKNFILILQSRTMTVFSSCRLSVCPLSWTLLKVPKVLDQTNKISSAIKF